jgi:hypothetical protein
MIMTLIFVVIVGLCVTAGVVVVVCIMACMYQCVDSCMESRPNNAQIHQSSSGDSYYDNLSMSAHFDPFVDLEACRVNPITINEHEEESSETDYTNQQNQIDEYKKHEKAFIKNNYMKFCHVVNSKASKEFPKEFLKFSLTEKVNAKHSFARMTMNGRLALKNI